MARKIELMEFSPTWKDRYREESIKLKDICGNHCRNIHHIGSTAIPGIFAKPIIDIMLIVDKISNLDSLNPEMVSAGYIPKGEYGIKNRRYFIKFMQNERFIHLHCFEIEDIENIDRHIAFRDYLINNSAIAKEYSNLKENLVSLYKGNVKLYAKGKGEFINKIEKTALIEGKKPSA